MKKKILAFAALVLCVCVFTSSTLAYFTKEDTATNVFTTSGIEIDLHEWADKDKTIPYGDMYENNTVSVIPSKKVIKVVNVENLQESAYIRAKYVVTVVKADNTVLSSESQLQSERDEINKIIIFTGKDENWEKIGDWYYYKTAVATGDTTGSLFEEVVFSGPEMTNKYQNCVVTIDVKTEAVQSKNNPIPQDKTVADVGGWN